MKSLCIVARIWRNEVGRNQHTVSIEIDGKLPHRCSAKYGGASQSIRTARDWLFNNGFLPNLDGRMVADYCKYNDVHFYCHIISVANERDLS